MTKLSKNIQFQPKAGFDWSKLTWGRPDSPATVLCSYCSASISDDEVPLILWRSDGSSVRFCEKCMRDWWDMEQ